MIPRILELDKYNNPKGQVYEGIKSSALDFDNFGEVYFSEILEGETKGWKKHKIMQMNLIVVTGNVMFYFFNEHTGTKTRVNAGEDNYRRIIVPPELWVAFRGYGKKNIICNIASIEHDPDEQVNVSLEEFNLSSDDFTEIK